MTGNFLFNIDKIIKIIIYDVSETDFEYVEPLKPIKLFGATIQKGHDGGWTDKTRYNPKLYSLDDLLKNNPDLFYNGVKVLRKPRIFLIFNRNEEIIYFDSFEEANGFVESFKDKGNFLIVKRYGTKDSV